jgi:hypothetical protein
VLPISSLEFAPDTADLSSNAVRLAIAIEP